MSTVIAAPAAVSMDPSKRRLTAGLLVSLLLHALVLSLQFGIPGLRPGHGAPLTVDLAPLPASPAAQPEPAPAAAVTLAAPAAPFPPVPAPVLAQARPVEPAGPVPIPRQGFTLLDPPRPQPAPPPPAIQPRRAPRRRTRAPAPATHDGLHTKVIAQEVHKDDSFTVPPAASEAAPDAEPKAVTADAKASLGASENVQARQADMSPAEPERQGVADSGTQPQEREQQQDQDRQAERERLAAQREQERAARREAEEQALQAAADLDARHAADQQERAVAQENARYEDDLISRQRQAEEEQRRHEDEQRQAAAREQAEREGARQLAEQQRIQAEQERAQQLAEQQRILAEQQRAQQLAEQQRAQQLAEQQRILAEQQRAQQLAEQQRAQQLAEQQRIQAEQQRAQQLAEQQRARQQADQLARDQAEQAAQAERIAREEQARRPRDDGIEPDGLARAGAVDNSGLDGVGRGAGTKPRAALDSPLASRARELLRGIDLDKPVPQAVRPAQEAWRNARRALADAALHDVPLRMYIDSIRQKIERNAILSPAQLAQDAVRIFPVVSITVRSDGSIEDVAIVRSSGRPDIDEVVRRIVHLNARYAAFPPNVAAHYDVVELRRVWSFAGALRLLEEMR